MHEAHELCRCRLTVDQNVRHDRLLPQISIRAHELARRNEAGKAGVRKSGGHHVAGLIGEPAGRSPDQNGKSVILHGRGEQDARRIGHLVDQNDDRPVESVLGSNGLNGLVAKVEFDDLAQPRGVSALPDVVFVEPLARS